MKDSASTTEGIKLRGLHYNIRRWGPADAPRVFMLHGWMDASPTFQFVVEALQQDWQIIAPDWRGHGDSDWLGRAYWFPDYYADLDALLAAYSPQAPAQLVGHSMGAGIAATYAGLRPERVARLAMLDFLGLKPPPEADAADQLRAWLNAQTQPPAARIHTSSAALAARLRLHNPRLAPARADFLARNISRPRPDGQLEVACDPWHKVPSPFVYRVEDAMAAWRRIAAPVLMLEAEDGFVSQRFDTEHAEYRRRLACFADVRVLRLPDTGHNLHHDQPAVVAAALEDFLQRG